MAFILSINKPKLKMNNKSPSILIKDMINNEHNESVPENYFSPVCDGTMNKIKSSRRLDTYQKNEEFSFDGINGRYSIDRLQTLPKNLHQAMDHSSENLLKLSPYSILDTEPTFLNMNLSTSLLRSHSLGKNMY